MILETVPFSSEHKIVQVRSLFLSRHIITRELEDST